MTLARECIKAMREEAHVVIAAGENPSDIVFRMMQRQALAFLRMLRDKGPSETQAEVVADVLKKCGINEDWDVRLGLATAALAAHIAELIREIEEER